MLHPNYEISIGNEIVRPASNELIRLTIDLHLDTPADSCRAILRPSKWTSDLEREDQVRVSLGYEDETKPVFAGMIDSIERTLSNVRTFSLGNAIRLLELRVNEIYSDQTAGDIVYDLADKAGVLADAMTGVSLPSYNIDTSRNAYDHIKELARRCAFDVYFDPDGRLLFTDESTEQTHPFEYGKNIISIQGMFTKPTYGSVKAYGESPSSTKGSDTSHWLSKDDVSGETGSGNQLEIVDPAVKDKDSAEKVAKARLKALSFSRFFKLTVVGSPEVQLGDAIEVKSMPEDLLNGKFKVMRVEHILSKTEGFKTLIECGGLKDE